MLTSAFLSKLCLQKLLCGHKLYTEAKEVCRLGQIRKRGVGGRNSNVGVLGIPVIGISCSGVSQSDTGLLAAADNLLGAAGKSLEADEVTAVGQGPASNTETSQLLIKGPLHHLKLGADDSCVLSHMGLDTVKILKVTDVAQLVDFIVTDGLVLHLVGDVLQIIERSGESCHPRTGEGDLGG